MRDAHIAATAGEPASDPVPLQIVIHERPADRVLEAVRANPCLAGAHAWAWLVAGGQECARCGVRR